MVRPLLIETSCRDPLCPENPRSLLSCCKLPFRRIHLTAEYMAHKSRVLMPVKLRGQDKKNQELSTAGISRLPHERRQISYAYTLCSSVLACSLFLMSSFFLLSSFFLSGCSSATNTFQYERLSREEVILEEVSAHPTQFIIESADQLTVWRRLYLLGTQYLNTSTAQTIIARPTTKGFHLSHNPAPGNQTSMDISYEVVALPMQSGQFEVRVRTAERLDGPMLKARNIARFLKTGTLERSVFSH